MAQARKGDRILAAARSVSIMVCLSLGITRSGGCDSVKNSPKVSDASFGSRARAPNEVGRAKKPSKTGHNIPTLHPTSRHLAHAHRTDPVGCMGAMVGFSTCARGRHTGCSPFARVGRPGCVRGSAIGQPGPVIVPVTGRWTVDLPGFR